MKRENPSPHDYHKAMRLNEYDYASSAAYAITILAKHGSHILCHPHLRRILETEWCKVSHLCIQGLPAIGVEK